MEVARESLTDDEHLRYEAALDGLGALWGKPDVPETVEARLGSVLPEEPRVRRAVAVELVALDIEHARRTNRPLELRPYLDFLDAFSLPLPGLDKLAEWLDQDREARRIEVGPAWWSALNTDLEGHPILDRLIFDGVIGPSGLKFKEVLGKGGQGEVFAFEDRGSAGRILALKRSDSGIREEAEILARLQGKGVPWLLGTLEDRFGTAWLIMQPVDGSTLLDYLKNKPPLRDRVAILEEICRVVHRAHDAGIVHHDLKSGNIKCGGSAGTVVLDWGLSRSGGGTWGYLAPEQGGHLLPSPPPFEPSAIGPAADIHALGAILHEILSGRAPDYRGEESKRRFVAGALSPPPIARGTDRRLDAIRRKAMSFRPEDRHPTAEALGNSLKAWLDDERIPEYRRRREPVLRFARKHPWRLAALMLVLVGVPAYGWWRLDRLSLADSRIDSGKHWLAKSVNPPSSEGAREIRAEADRAEAALAFVVRPPISMIRTIRALRDESDRIHRDSRMLEYLDAARMRYHRLVAESYDRKGKCDEYRLAFNRHGIDMENATSESIAASLAESRIKSHLVAALEDWAASESTDSPFLGKCVEIADLLDPDPDRRKLRRAIRVRNLDEVVAWCEQYVRPETVSAEELLAPSHLLEQSGRWTALARLLRPVGIQLANDYWVQQRLASALGNIRPPDAESELAHASAARSLRPDVGISLLSAAAAHMHLAEQNLNSGDRAKSIRFNNIAADYYGKAAAKLGRISFVENNWGNCLTLAGRPREAIPHLRNAVASRKNYAKAWINLGVAFREVGELDAALQACENAVQAERGNALAHITMGEVQLSRRSPSEAVKSYRIAVDLVPKDTMAHFYLGRALRAAGEGQAGIEAFRESVRLAPDNAVAQSALGVLLMELGYVEDSIPPLSRALALSPKDHNAALMLSEALEKTNDAPGAVAAMRQAVFLQPRDSRNHFKLGRLLMINGRQEEALRELEESVRLNSNEDRAWSRIGQLFSLRGDFRAEEIALRRAKSINPGYWERSYNLGLALNHQNRYFEAYWEFAEAERQAKSEPGGTLIDFDSLLAATAAYLHWARDRHAAMARSTSGATPKQLLLLGNFANLEHGHRAAARFYLALDRLRPVTSDLDLEMLTASQPLLGAAGVGEADLSPEAIPISELRSIGLRRLEAVVHRRRLLFERDPIRARPHIARLMNQLLTLPQLARYRDSKYLAELPESERLGFEGLWRAAAELRDKAEGR